MTTERVVLLDTNIFQNFRALGGNGCELLEFVIECHGDVAEGDAPELKIIDYCDPMLPDAGIADHGISDEQALAWFASQSAENAEFLRKLINSRTCADLKLLMRGIDLKGREVLITCDSGLLSAAARWDVSRRCFKAAIDATDKCMGGGIRDSEDWGTDQMEVRGTHPYFHYGHDLRCPQCDPKSKCKTRARS